MELNTLTQQEYNRDIVQTNLREIFEPGKYIAPKTQSAFDDIRAKLSEIFENFNFISSNELNFDAQLNDKFLNLDFGSEFSIDATKIGVNDAIFFINLLNQNNQISYGVENNQINLLDNNNQKINATNSLLNMLQSSYDTKKPIRLDFGNDITVILKLDKEGKIQAHFIPGTSEAENYLRNNISCLKQNFDKEEINYSYLGYSKQNKKDENKNSKKQKRSN